MALGGKTSWTKPSIDVSLLTPLLKMGKQNKSCLVKQKTCNIMYPKNHWILRFWGVWMCIAGVLDHQTTSFEIPWFLGYIKCIMHTFMNACISSQVISYSLNSEIFLRRDSLILQLPLREGLICPVSNDRWIFGWTWFWINNAMFPIKSTLNRLHNSTNQQNYLLGWFSVGFD